MDSKACLKAATSLKKVATKKATITTGCSAANKIGAKLRQWNREQAAAQKAMAIVSVEMDESGDESGERSLVLEAQPQKTVPLKRLNAFIEYLYKVDPGNWTNTNM